MALFSLMFWDGSHKEKFHNLSAHDALDMMAEPKRRKQNVQVVRTDTIYQGPVKMMRLADFARPR